MKIKLPTPPTLPSLFSISQSSLRWFVTYSPLKCKRILIDKRLLSIYIKAKTQDRILYCELRKQIHLQVALPSNPIPVYHLLKLFNIEKRTEWQLGTSERRFCPPYSYPGWIFGKHNSRPHHITPTPHPTADQIIFLLSIPYTEWGNYLNFDMCQRYHPDILYGRKVS